MLLDQGYYVEKEYTDDADVLYNLSIVRHHPGMIYLTSGCWRKTMRLLPDMTCLPLTDPADLGFPNCRLYAVRNRSVPANESGRAFAELLRAAMREEAGEEAKEKTSEKDTI